MKTIPNLQGGPLRVCALQTVPEFSGDMIVSWGPDGQPRSYFSDLVWDFSAYSSNGKPSNFLFNNWCLRKRFPTEQECLIIEEFKKWICYLIYLRGGIPISITTVKHFFDLIVLMCRFAREKNLNLIHVMSIDEVCLEFVERHSPNQLRSLGQLISTFQQFSFSEIQFEVVGRSLLEKVKARQTAYRNNQPSKQHPPLPTRIYSTFIANLTADLQYNEKLLPSLLGLTAACFNYRRLPQACRNEGAFVCLLESCDLHAHFSGRNFSLTLNGLNRAILELFASCKLVIHTFSGMRDGEVEFLERDCLAPVSRFGVKHYMINGYTTKFTNGKKISARWVVSEEAYRAVCLVREISGLIHKLVYGVDPRPNSPLFLSPGLFSKRFRTKEGAELGVPRLDLCHFKELQRRLISNIEVADLEELNNIDPFRVWDLESDFRVGNPWRLTVHQLRRSLALYATRSGLVTLPSLKRQLQHITEEMTRYYASGSFFAKNVLEPYSEHFSEIYFNSLPESQALAFMRNVLNSSEPIFGAAGTWYKKPDGVEVTSVSVVEITKQVKKGILNNTDTPVGSCTKVGDCPHRSFGVFSHCVSACDKSVLKLSKLELLISAQQKRVDNLDSASIMWNNEHAVLMDYMYARDRILKKKGGR
ncbi:hypothetical protein ABKS89_11560 [Pseudomonas sp. LABIM340]|uniref:hypothetical protein n=1 Tax=Pseudomonas sp. LABIM340 TaxID=3156585 RepID=UPI0032AF60EA